MSIVTLVSGGLDSTLMALFIKEAGIKQFPLFVDYGQLCKEAELKACLSVHQILGLPDPMVMNVCGFGKSIYSGLTNASARINEDAFLPCRNLLFLVVGSAYVCETKSNCVAIGMLSEESRLFPDQSTDFIKKTEELVSLATGCDIKIVTPLIEFTKADVLKIAKQKSIEGTYSCHAGTFPSCGKCVSCNELRNASNKGEV